MNHEIKKLLRCFITAVLSVTMTLCLCPLAHSKDPQLNPAGQIAPSSKGAAAKIVQNQPLWWFNGETCSDYHETASLKLINAPVANYSWAITTGANKIAITRRSAMEIGVKTIGASAPAAKFTRDIVVTVTLNGKTIATKKTAVYRPYTLKYLGTTDSAAVQDPANPTRSIRFVSLINYNIMDQFNHSIPRPMPINEDFDRTAIKRDWGGRGAMNWIPPYPNGEDGYSGDEHYFLTDMMASAWGTGLIPQPVTPADPKANQKVLHFSGYWNAGSSNQGRGAQLRSLHWGNYTYLIWRFYRGFGRHE